MISDINNGKFQRNLFESGESYTSKEHHKNLQQCSVTEHKAEILSGGKGMLKLTHLQDGP